MKMKGSDYYMSAKFAGLDVTRVLYFFNQGGAMVRGLWREERDQSMILVALRDGKTGESGHVLYCVEVDKRDIVEEKMWTDNPKLFATNHGGIDAEPQELLCLVDDSTPRQKTEEIDAIIGACRHGTQVEYTDGPDGWGLYAGHKVTGSG